MADPGSIWPFVGTSGRAPLSSCTRRTDVNGRADYYGICLNGTGYLNLGYTFNDRRRLIHEPGVLSLEPGGVLCLEPGGVLGPEPGVLGLEPGVLGLEPWSQES